MKEDEYFAEIKCNLVWKQLVNWFDASNLTKKQVTLDSQQDLILTMIFLNLEQVSINNLQDTKFLGVYLDEDLCWTSHC